MFPDGSLWALCRNSDGLESVYVDICRGSSNDLGDFDDQVIYAYAQIFFSGKEIKIIRVRAIFRELSFFKLHDRQAWQSFEKEAVRLSKYGMIAVAERYICESSIYSSNLNIFPQKYKI